MHSSKEEKKIIVFDINGWNLSNKVLGNLFHYFYFPYFRNVYQNNRSLSLFKDAKIDCSKSFLHGKACLNDEEKKKAISNNFWQSPEIIKIQERLKKNNGRLWLFLPEENTMTKVIDGIQRSGFVKIGIYKKNRLSQRNFNRPIDLVIFDRNQIRRSLKKVFNIEDCVIYFCDLNEIDQFLPIIKLQTNRPLYYFVLSDRENLDLLPNLTRDSPTIHLKEALEMNNVNFREETYNQKIPKKINNIDKSDRAFNYQKFNFNWDSCLIEELIDLISTSILNNDHQVILMSSGQDNFTQSELLPLIFIDRQKKYNNRSYIEDCFNFNYSVIDFAPTVLNFFGITDDFRMEGKSLLPKLYPEHIWTNFTKIERKPIMLRKIF